MFIALLVACAGTPIPAVDDRPEPNTTRDGATRPRVVLAVVLDQFPSHAALDYLPHLDEDGLLRRMVREGTFVERVRFSYASTSTAPGHAAIHTGRPPAESGIDANDVWDAATKKEVAIVSRGGDRIFGVQGARAGPAILTARTVADELRSQHPDSVILSLSHKARSAILSGGTSPSAAIWYHTAIPGFTTSAAYAAAMPPWLEEFNRERPPSSAYGRWEAEDPELYERLFGPDDAPGEASWYGLGTTFPHEPSKSDRPEKVFRASPHSVDYLLDVARRSIDELEVGRDDIVDLVCISVSTTDYAGHSYSVSSWEYLDVLRKTDRKLGAFVRELEGEIGPVSVLLTSDHGGPRFSPEKAGHGGRIIPADLVTRMDAAVDRALGKNRDWVAAYVAPYLYLTETGRAHRDEVTSALQREAGRDPQVELIAAPAEARTWIGGDDPLRDAVGQSIPADRTDLYVLPAEGYFNDAERKPDIGKGINHGTPLDHDREVPLLVMGAGIESRRVAGVVPQARVAATIAGLLGVPSPVPEEPLDAVRPH